MTRGKYAAKAKNRLANLDNEILQEKLTEIVELKAEISSLNQALSAERAERGRLVLERAEELSRQQIDLVRREAREQIDAGWVARREVAQELGDYFLFKNEFPPLFWTKVLPRLLPTKEMNAFTDKLLDDAGKPSGRHVRRHGGENIRRASSRAFSNNRTDQLIRAATVAKLSASAEPAELPEMEGGDLDVEEAS